MASYKKPCIHCGTLVDADIRFCPGCGSGSPFGSLCPTCLRPVNKGDALCSGCGRPLTVICPFCGQPVFAGERCARCGQSLMIRCENPRCGVLQFFENTKCTACGKKIKQKK